MKGGRSGCCRGVGVGDQPALVLVLRGSRFREAVVQATGVCVVGASNSGERSTLKLLEC